MSKESNTSPIGVFFTGKRFCGKDTAAQMLQETLIAQRVDTVIRSTALYLKQQFCIEKGFDLHLLLTSREYKESLRDDLDAFVLNKSQDDNFNDFLASIAVDLATQTTIIVSDLRNLTDYEGLRTAMSTHTVVEIVSSDKARLARGWESGLHDESMFETNYKEIPVSHTIENNGSIEGLKMSIVHFSQEVMRLLTK